MQQIFLNLRKQKYNLILEWITSILALKIQNINPGGGMIMIDDKNYWQLYSNTFIQNMYLGSYLKHTAYEIFTTPLSGDLLMDFPTSESWGQLWNYVCDREYWRLEIQSAVDATAFSLGDPGAGI